MPGRVRMALTGTPVENRLSELWSLLDWTTPGLLGAWTASASGSPGPSSATPTPRPRTFRPDGAALPAAPAQVRPRHRPGAAGEDRDRPAGAAHPRAGVAVRGGVPRPWPRSRQDEGLSAARPGDPAAHRAQADLQPSRPLLQQAGPLPGRSGKLDALDELLGVILEEGKSALVFTQYVQMGRLIEGASAPAWSQSPVSARRRWPPASRDAMVAASRRGRPRCSCSRSRPAVSVLDLTRATHVLHYDRWWNPAVEDQATDRAHRIGQHRPVQVHRMIAEGTLEDQIAAVLAASGSSPAVVGGGESWISELSTPSWPSWCRCGRRRDPPAAAAARRGAAAGPARRRGGRPVGAPRPRRQLRGDRLGAGPRRAARPARRAPRRVRGAGARRRPGRGGRGRRAGGRVGRRPAGAESPRPGGGRGSAGAGTAATAAGRRPRRDRWAGSPHRGAAPASAPAGGAGPGSRPSSSGPASSPTACPAGAASPAAARWVRWWSCPGR